MPSRRILAGLALIAVVIVAVVIVRSGGDDEPASETVRGLRGFPVRGSLAGDRGAIDAAVAEWREEIADDAGDDDDDDDPEERARTARRPDADDDVAVLFIGRADDREDVAILESRGLVAQLERRRGAEGWFLHAERLREEDFRGEFPIAVGDAILVPEGTAWTYVDAGFSTGFENTGDGLFRDSGGLSGQGFLLPQTPGRELVPIQVTGVGPRSLRRDDYEALTAALHDGFGRSIWLAAAQAESALTDDADDVRPPDDPPALSVLWTGRVPDYAHAAAVLQGDGFGGQRAAALGYGDTPGPEARSEDKDEGSVALGSADRGRGTQPPDTFTAGAYAHFHDFPYLVLAGAGSVKTLHAFVGDQEVTRKAPLAVIDARRFSSDDGTDTVIFGRTADGRVIAPFDSR
jgi:hypothetical protein